MHYKKAMDTNSAGPMVPEEEEDYCDVTCDFFESQ